LELSLLTQDSYRTEERGITGKSKLCTEAEKLILIAWSLLRHTKHLGGWDLLNGATLTVD